MYEGLQPGMTPGMHAGDLVSNAMPETVEKPQRMGSLERRCYSETSQGLEEGIDRSDPLKRSRAPGPMTKIHESLHPDTEG